MTNELQQCMLKQIENTISKLQDHLDTYSSRVINKSTNLSTKPLKTELSNLAKLIDTLDVLDSSICQEQRIKHENPYKSNDVTVSSTIVRA